MSASREEEPVQALPESQEDAAVQTVMADGHVKPDFTKMSRDQLRQAAARLQVSMLRGGKKSKETGSQRRNLWMHVRKQ